MVKKYRKRPVVIEAIQYTGDNIKEIADWAGGEVIEDAKVYHEPYVRTLEGKMSIAQGDFVIKGVQGEFYPCKPDIFEKTYEAA